MPGAGDLQVERLREAGGPGDVHEHAVAPVRIVAGDERIVVRYEAAQAQPINTRTSVLTPLGHAVAAASRLRKALEPLPAADRAHVLAEFAPVMA